MQKQLNKLLQDYQQNPREGSILSSQTADTISKDDKETWRAIRKELEELGLSVSAFQANKIFILDWFREAIAKGAFREEAAGINSEAYEQRSNSDVDDPARSSAHGTGKGITSSLRERSRRLSRKISLTAFETVTARSREEERVEAHQIPGAAAPGIAGGIPTAAALDDYNRNSDAIVRQYDVPKPSVDRKKWRRRRSSKDQGRGAIVPTNIEDDFAKHHVPPMPMQNDVCSSEIARHSIPSEPTREAPSAFERIHPVEIHYVLPLDEISREGEAAKIAAREARIRRISTEVMPKMGQTVRHQSSRVHPQRYEESQGVTPSETSKPLNGNPKLLEPGENAIRQMIMPELERLIQE